MRVAVALGGTDRGRSGIGTYARAILPRLARRLTEARGSLVAMGTAADLDAYADVLDGADRYTVADLFAAPGPNALWHLYRSGAAAARTGADVLLLPAANRRTTARAPLPTVAVVHDLAQLHVARKYDPLRMAYLRYAVVGALRTADRLVAVSSATRDDLVQALGRHAPPVDVVENGVEHERFTPPGDEPDPRVAAARAEVRLEGPYVLYTSRLEHPGKNHVRLVTAFARSTLRHSHVLALAGGNWGGREAIEAEIARHGLGDWVRLLGYVSDAILPGLVAGADLVLMVGLREGFGLPALEALSAGRPVCVSRTGALPEVVGPLGILCDPFDEASIAAGLEQGIGDTAHRARCADEGPGWAAARSWDRTAEGLLTACEQVLRAT